MGDPLETLKQFRKNSQSRNTSKGGPFSLVQFCKNTKKLLAETGTQTRDLWVTSKPINLCTRKWYIQGELCGEKKNVLKNQDGNV